MQIEELNTEELETVSGGIAPVLVYAAFVGVGFGLAAAADYLNGGFDD